MHMFLVNSNIVLRLRHVQQDVYLRAWLDRGKIESLMDRSARVSASCRERQIRTMAVSAWLATRQQHQAVDMSLRDRAGG
jgi:hypothetical protein